MSLINEEADKMKKKSISVEEDLHEFIRRKGEMGETFSDVLRRLVGFKPR